MGYAQTVIAPASAAVARTPRKRSLIGRILHAIAESNMRHAEREIARYLDSTGGKFTDSAEREIERRYLSSLLH